MEKRRPGRPRKTEGTIAYNHFRRAGIVTWAYDTLRSRDRKHSVAVTEVVEFIKRRYPKFRISDTTVKRILSKYRPRNSGLILRCKRIVATKEDLAKRRLFLGKVVASYIESGLKPPPLPDINPSKPVKKFVFSFGERPTYPRYNRKDPPEPTS